MVGTRPAKNMSEQLLQRSVGMALPDEYYQVNYELIFNGTPDEVREEFDKWTYSAGQMIYVKNIPDDMDEHAIRELFGEYGWIDTLEFVGMDRTAIIKFTNIRRWDFAGNIADRHPEPYALIVNTNILYCGLHVPETKEKTISEMADMITRLEQRVGELTDNLMLTNHRLLDVTQDFYQEKSQMTMKITQLTELMERLNNLEGAIMNYADEY
jgi:hypothetical protein